MSDQDFNFSPPPPRRERKEFEPPPWEQHLFERMTKERETESAAPGSIEVVELAGETEPEQDEAVEVPVVVHQAAAAGLSPRADEEAAKNPLLDEVRLAAMMFELKAEEVPATRMFTTATVVAGAILLLIGIVMVIWSFVMITVALRRPDQGRPGLIVGIMVLLFGVGFAGTGAWFVFRTLRQQGVL